MSSTRHDAFVCSSWVPVVLSVTTKRLSPPVLKGEELLGLDQHLETDPLTVELLRDAEVRR